MIKQFSAVLVMMISLLAASSANANVYFVSATGYTEVDYYSQRSSDMPITIAVGYEFHKQWSVEVGYQQLAGEASDTEGVDASAVSVALHGKAGNQTGELFYSLGIMAVDAQGVQNADADGQCSAGSLIATSGLCDLDDTTVAGTIGIGFDTHLGYRAMVRVAAEHVFSNDDFSANVFTVGFRYNF